MKKNHIDHISMKISKVIGIMYRLKDIYPKTFNILLTSYNSLIVPHLNYCILTWGTKSKMVINTYFAEENLKDHNGQKLYCPL